MDITGVAYIVGGGSGIGKATALAFAAEGASGLAVADLDAASAEEVVKAAQAAAVNPEFRALSFGIDVTDETSVFSATDKVVEHFGRIDYCAITAGIGVAEAVSTTDLDPGFFKRMLDVNVVGSFLVTLSVGRVMKEQDFTPCTQSPERAVTRGTIVHLGSGAAYTAAPGQCPYTVSKHAVLGLSRSAAIDLVGSGVRVNCLCPGWIDTPLVQRAKEHTPGLDEMTKKLVPVGRLGMAEETADAIIYLSSPRASYVNGCALAIDAGLTVLIKSGV